MADQLTDIVTDAVLTIRQKDKPLDLHMVEARAAWARLETGASSAAPLPPSLLP